MHEFSLMADLMRQIEVVACREGAGKVAGVRVWLGALSHISPEHFREHFARAAKGTLAEGADLQVELSTDESEPRAQQILLKSLVVED